MPSEGIAANLPKKKEKTNMADNGWISAHSTPKTVCL
jgi:hypothetical protein